jgi:hypothetical protein
MLTLKRSTSCAAAFAAALHILTVAAPAMAQQPAPSDNIVLKDGGSIKGTLTEILPGDHATVQLPSGQTATVRWDVIHHIERGGVTVQTQQAPQANTVVVQAPAPDARGKATVHMEGDQEIVLERQISGQWVTVCNAPCDLALELDSNYRVSGGGIRRSGAFRLAGKPGDHIIITIDPASKGGFAGGIVLIAIGAPAFVIGGLTLLVVAAIDASNSGCSTTSYYNNCSTNTDTGTAKIVGWSMLGGGAAGVVLGIVLVSTNGHTSTEQSVDGRKAAWVGVQRMADNYTKSPVFREARDMGILPVGGAVQTLPLFSGKF